MVQYFLRSADACALPAGIIIRLHWCRLDICQGLAKTTVYSILKPDGIFQSLSWLIIWVFLMEWIQWSWWVLFQYEDIPNTSLAIYAEVCTWTKGYAVSSRAAPGPQSPSSGFGLPCRRRHREQTWEPAYQWGDQPEYLPIHQRPWGNF